MDTIPGVAWVKRVIAFPIGERFALISITAAIWSPRTTFIALLAWNGVAATYGFVGRLLRWRTLARRSDTAATELELYRDDGPIARALADLIPPTPRLPPHALVVAAVVPLIAAIAIRGDDASEATAVAVI